MANSVGDGEVRTVTLTAATGTLADNDVIAALQEVPRFYRQPGGQAYIHTLVLVDPDDQGQDVELVFFNATGSIGAENDVYAPADAVLKTINGSVLISTTDYSDANTGQSATITNVGLMTQGAKGSDSIFVGAVCRSGTPAYGGGELTLRIGVAY